MDVQKSFDVTYDSHGIRLDVYADDAENIRFAVEMQTRQGYNILKRSRYYHSVMDIDELLKGRDYGQLKDNYVIFICGYRLFDSDLHQFNYGSVCRQNPDLPTEGRETILLSTEGCADDVSPDLHAFLRYVKSSTDETAEQLDNGLVHKIHDKVKQIKQNQQLEVEYLKFEELMKESRQEGIAEGIEKGFEKGIEKGIERGRSEGINAFIAEFVEEGIPKERIVEKLVKRFALASEDAASHYDGFIAASRSRC